MNWRGLLPVVALILLAGMDAWFAAVSYSVGRPPIAVATVVVCIVVAYQFGRRQQAVSSRASAEKGRTLAVMHVIITGLWDTVNRYNLQQEANTELGQHGIHLTQSDQPVDDPRSFAVEVDSVVFTDSLEQMTEEMEEAIAADE